MKIKKQLISILLITIFLFACSTEPAYRFRELDGNTRTFKKSEYMCYYKKQKENSFYVECFPKEEGSAEFFFADKVIDEGVTK